MKYYLVRIDQDGNHRVQGEFDLSGNVKLIIGNNSGKNEQQYILPEILLPKVTDTGITTTVKDFDNVFDYQEKPIVVDELAEIEKVK